VELGERIGQKIVTQQRLSADYELMQKQRDAVNRQLAQIYEEFLRVSGEIRALRELERDGQSVANNSEGQVGRSDSPVQP
jgi:hypothetical protein